MNKLLFVSLGLLLLTACSDSATTTTDADLVVYGSSSASDATSSLTFNGSVNGFSADEVAPVGSPTELNITAYAFYLSTATDCSNPVLVGGDGVTGVEQNFVGEPVLFEATIDSGTYPCLIFVMNDNMTFIPDVAAELAWPDACSSDEVSTFDIYRADSGETTPWIDIDGNEITATGEVGTPGNDVVTIFASTDVDAVIATGVNENQTGLLTESLVVPGTTTFYFDFTDGIVDNDGNCWVEEASLGFR